MVKELFEQTHFTEGHFFLSIFLVFNFRTHSESELCSREAVFVTKEIY